MLGQVEEEDTIDAPPTPKVEVLPHRQRRSAVDLDEMELPSRSGKVRTWRVIYMFAVACRQRAYGDCIHHYFEPCGDCNMQTIFTSLVLLLLLCNTEFNKPCDIL